MNYIKICFFFIGQFKEILWKPVLVLIPSISYSVDM